MAIVSLIVSGIGALLSAGAFYYAHRVDKRTTELLEKIQRAAMMV